MSTTQILRERETAVVPEEARERWYIEGEPEKNDDGQQTQPYSSATRGVALRTLRKISRPSLRGISAFSEIILNWWIGEVYEVYDDYFVARMVDVNGEESIAEFDLTEVRMEDQDRVEVGAAFTFAVTREDRRDGRRRVIKMEFLEPYRWTAQDEERSTRLVREHFPESSGVDD
jgi:hypothetical protein